MLHVSLNSSGKGTDSGLPYQIFILQHTRKPHTFDLRSLEFKIPSPCSVCESSAMGALLEIKSFEITDNLSRILAASTFHLVSWRTLFNLAMPVSRLITLIYHSARTFPPRFSTRNPIHVFLFASVPWNFRRCFEKRRTWMEAHILAFWEVFFSFAHLR